MREPLRSIITARRLVGRLADPQQGLAAPGPAGICNGQNGPAGSRRGGKTPEEEEGGTLLPLAQLLTFWGEKGLKIFSAPWGTRCQPAGLGTLLSRCPRTCGLRDSPREGTDEKNNRSV